MLTGSIPVYVYTPNNVASDAPILVYFHGGGMVLGSRENAEPLCHIISAYVTLYLYLSVYTYLLIFSLFLRAIFAAELFIEVFV